MEPANEKPDLAAALLQLIADSEKARQKGRWLTQEQMEDLLKKTWREL